MPEQQPLRICVICLLKARSLERRGKKEERGNRQLLVWAGTGGRIFTHQATVAADWMESDRWDVHMESRWSSAAQHCSTSCTTTTKIWRKTKKLTDGGRERNLERESGHKEGPRELLQVWNSMNIKKAIRYNQATNRVCKIWEHCAVKKQKWKGYKTDLTVLTEWDL